MCKTGGKGWDGASEIVKIKYLVALDKQWTRNVHFFLPLSKCREHLLPLIILEISMTSSMEVFSQPK